MGNANAITSAPKEVSDAMKCTSCGELLTCPPVYLCSRKGNICGRCPESLDGLAERNSAFEALLSLQMLPCRYFNKGCIQECKSSDMKTHEESCKYRQFVCPSLPLGSCVWQGVKTASSFKDHFNASHQNILFGNEATPLKLVSDSVTNILVIHDSKAFLLQLNYQLKTQTLWSALLYYENPPANQSYMYVLELISQGGKKYVFPSSCCYSAVDTLLVNKSKMCETPLTQVRNIMDNTKELAYNITISI